MSKISKKAIPIFILVTMMLALVPINLVSAVENVTLDEYEGIVGDEITVEGEGVTAGATVNIYWDIVRSSFTDGKGLIGSTEAESDGSFEFEFEIPEAGNGDHYVWVKDLESGESEQADAPFVVLTDAELSTTSGLEGDDVMVDGTGFAPSMDIAIILFDDYATAPFTGVVGEDTGEVGDGDEDEFTFSTENTPVVPGSVMVLVDGVLAFTDNGDGSLEPENEDDEGSINYITGDIELEFDDAPADGAEITIDYSYVENVEDLVYIFTTTGDTDNVGTFSEEVTVPDIEDMDFGTYDLVSWDGDGHDFVSDFSIGAVITLDMDEGPVGSVVSVEGRGFLGEDMVDSITIDSTVCEVMDEDDLEIDEGDFDLEFVIPQVDDEDDYTITIEAGAITVTADFEVTELASVEVEPNFGLQGESVTVRGYNFVHEAEEEVTVSLGGLGETTFETDDDGFFEGSFTIPGVSQGTHTLMAEQTDFNIDADTDFKAGLIVVVATPKSVKVGEKITFTGSGFTFNGEWNASFADITVEDDGDVNAQGTFTKEFYVPTVEPGTYTVTFTDIDEDAETYIEVTTEITITENTMLTLEPIQAPNEYKIIITGMNFKYEDGLDPEFTLFNDTEDWDITDDVFFYDEEEEGDDAYTDMDVVTDDEEGNFTAWWEVYDDEEISLGTYTLEVVVEDDWMANATIEIVEATITVSPQKDTFQQGETVAFNIVNSFAQDDSYIEVMDPQGELVWKTDDFNEGGEDDAWIKVGTVYRVPYYQQTAGQNPMILTSDAALGTWSFTMYDSDDDEIASGTFNVVEAAEGQIQQQIDELSQDISDLQDQIAGVQDQVTDAAASAEAAAQAAQNAQEAVQGIESVATSARDAAQAAEEAANNAQETVSGIQTLVYIAIAGSVIAALAAIVSLMQISRRIAG
jgi:hypothetical protein